MTRGKPKPVAGKESYFGGKGSSFRHLVNQIPPHNHLIVPFAGHCAIVRNIRLPENTWMADKDHPVILWWNDYLQSPEFRFSIIDDNRYIEINQRCGIELLETLDFDTLDRPFIYLDPPYLLSTRKSGSRYRNEMTDTDHRRLLEAAKQATCPVMISGYMSPLYGTLLRSWRHYTFQASTRRGMATEHVWCNYPEPTRLQDYRWLGANKQERFKLTRREKNLIDKLNRFSDIERNALLAAIVSHFGDNESR